MNGLRTNLFPGIALIAFMAGVLLLAGGGVVRAEPAADAPHAEPAEAEAVEEAEAAGLRRFIRAAEPEPQLFALEVAIRRYESDEAGRPPIDLVGVIHIGEPGYYEALQAHLDEQPLVLFEGVGKPPFIAEPDDRDVDRVVRTRHGLHFLAGRIEAYHEREGQYPPDLETLLDHVAQHAPGEARWTRAAMEDHWQRTLDYERKEEGYTLKSLGADGEPGGEGVNADLDLEDDLPRRGHPPQAEQALQPGVAQALGLVFQLDAMNYDRPSFAHADMSLTELNRALAARREGDVPEFQQRHPDPPEAVILGGGDGEAEQMNELLRVFNGTRFTSAILGVVQGLLADSPNLRQFSRMVMIEVLGRIDGDLTDMPGMSPAMQQLMQALIIDRNRILVREVRERLEDEDFDAPSLSLFYGAGHMPDLARQLHEELGYEATGQVEWLTAFEADMRNAGLEAEQIEFFRGLIRLQLRSLNR